MKYAHYLSMPALGSHPPFELAGGESDKAALAKENHLEACAFSDFYMDPTTGNFGGEIRLAYLVKDGKRSPVTGGSITGNIMENRGIIRFSSELSDYNSCSAPETCLVPKVRIAKAE